MNFNCLNSIWLTDNPEFIFMKLNGPFWHTHCYFVFLSSLAFFIISCRIRSWSPRANEKINHRAGFR
jgi:hypothetical protein